MYSDDRANANYVWIESWVGTWFPTHDRWILQTLSPPTAVACTLPFDHTETNTPKSDWPHWVDRYHMPATTVNRPEGDDSRLGHLLWHWTIGVHSEKVKSEMYFLWFSLMSCPLKCTFSGSVWWAFLSEVIRICRIRHSTNIVYTFSLGAYPLWGGGTPGKNQLGCATRSSNWDPTRSG